jgi:hypothetical protein
MLKILFSFVVLVYNKYYSKIIPSKSTKTVLLKIKNEITSKIVFNLAF